MQPAVRTAGSRSVDRAVKRSPARRDRRRRPHRRRAHGSLADRAVPVKVGACRRTLGAGPGMRANDDPTTEGPLAHRAVELAEALLREAREQQTPEERAQAKKLARMMADPHGKELTIALADQAFRSHRPERIADQLALSPRAVRGATVHGLVGAGGAPPGRRHGALSPQPGGASRREPPTPGDAERHPARRGGGPPPLPRGAAPRGHATEPQPARRGDPRRGGGSAPAGRVPRAARPRRRRVHLGEGLVDLQPDRSRRLSRDGRARGRAAAHALPRRRRGIATGTPTGGSRRSSSTSTWRSTATST